MRPQPPASSFLVFHPSRRSPIFAHRLHADGEFPVETISKVYPVAEFDKAVEDMCVRLFLFRSTVSLTLACSLARRKKGEVIKPIISFV